VRQVTPTTALNRPHVIVDDVPMIQRSSTFIADGNHSIFTPKVAQDFFKGEHQVALRTIILSTVSIMLEFNPAA